MNRQDFFRIARSVIRNSPTSGLDTSAVDAPGSNLNILVNGVSAMAEECESRSVSRFAALLTTSAQGQDLDNLILDQTYGKLPRKGASAAVYRVALARTNTTGAAFVPPGTEILAGAFVYTLDSPGVTFPDGDASQKICTFTCSSTGSATNLPVTSITGFKNKSALPDPTITVGAITYFNPTATQAVANTYASGGADSEVDSAYAGRRAQYGGGLDRNVDLLAAGALATPGVSYAVATEVTDSDGNPAGPVFLYVSDVNGRANSALLDRAQATLRNFRMVGQNVQIYGTIPSLQAITVSIAIQSGFGVSVVQNNIQNALLAYVNNLNPGVTLLLASLASVIRSVDGVVFLDSAPYGVTVPASNVAFSSTTTVRTSADLITFA